MPERTAGEPSWPGAGRRRLERSFPGSCSATMKSCDVSGIVGRGADASRRAFLMPRMTSSFAATCAGGSAHVSPG
jgi:hypothetical protein